MHIMLNTGGGDAPGLNAVIRAVTIDALRRGWKVTGIRRGYHGLLAGFPDDLMDLDRRAVRGIGHLGGTILGTVNRGHPFEYPVQKDDGSWELTDVSDQVIENFHKVGADCLIAIGGDGSLRIANRFAEKGLPIIGVPKTIDNDLSCTNATFGFDTAVSFATDAIDRLHSTAEAHCRVMVVEVMGRYAGWIALHAGVAGTADVILMPEIPFDMEAVCKKIEERYHGPIGFAIVVVAEGAIPKDGDLHTKGQELGKEVQLGGIGEWVAKEINRLTGRDTRSLVLGHLQRGGSPTTFDRLLATRFGCAAVRAAEAGDFGRMVAFQPPQMTTVPILDAIKTMKSVPLDSDTMITARDVGICLGD